MIDEELYQQAADELNSDRRRAHIWARACALSKDDHDEARYLYTNLRVEELIAERGADSDTDGITHSIDHSQTQAMEPALSLAPESSLPLDDTADFEIDSALDIDDTSILPADSKLNLDDDPLLENLVSDSAPLSPMEKEYYEKHPDQLKEMEEDGFKDSLQRGNEDLDVLLDGLSNSKYTEEDESDVLSADFMDSTSTHAILIDDEMDWLEDDDQVDDAQTNLQQFTPQSQFDERDETERFTQDLLRQVDELPGQHSDVVSSDEPVDEEPTWEPSSRANEAAVGTAAAIGATRYGEVSEKNQIRRSTTSSTDTSRLPIDLTNGKSGVEYTVYRRDQKVQAVKKGVSWSALFFTVPFLIYRHMFATAIVYTIMSLIVAAGLIFTGLSWIDAGASASNLIKLTTVGFGLLAVVGIFYLPMRHANNWRSEKLERRGFELVARVKAGNPGKAVALARRASALD